MSYEEGQEVTRHVVYCKKSGIVTTIYRKHPKGVNPICPICKRYAPFSKVDDHVELKEVKSG